MLGTSTHAAQVKPNVPLLVLNGIAHNICNNPCIITLDIASGGRVRYDVGDMEIEVQWYQRDISGGDERRIFTA